MLTNEVKLSFDYVALDLRFDIFELKNQKLKFDIKALDCDDLNIKAISFAKEGLAHILCYKNTLSTEELANKLENFIIRKIQANLLADHELFNLLLRSLNHEGYSNLSGKLYIYHPNNLKAQNGEITSFDALEVSLNSKNLLCLNARKFTLLSKLKDKKAEFLPMYEFCKNSFRLKKVREKSKNVYVKKPQNNKKGRIDFLNVSGYDEFCASKVGIFYDLLDSFEKNFGYFVSLELQKISGFEQITLSNADQNKFSKHLKDLLKGKIALINTLDDSALGIVDAAFGALELDYELLNKPSKDKLNLVLIRPKSEYTSDDDPYKVALNTQHLCIESGQKSLNKAILQTALKELIIKDDLSKSKISLYKEKIDEISFISCFDDDLNSIYEMKIKPDLSFEIKNILGEELIELHSLLKNSAGLIKKQNNINIISNTDIIVLSSKELQNVLKEKKQNFSITKDQFEAALALCDKEIANSLKLKLKECKNLDTKSIREAISKLAPAHKSKIDEAFRKACGHGIIGAVRGKNQQKQYLLGLSDLSYKKTQNEIHYTIGAKSSGLQANFATANHIKIVSAAQGSKMFFEECLPLLKVFFVKNEGATVLPFAFKYLREFHKLKSANV